MSSATQVSIAKNEETTLTKPTYGDELLTVRDVAEILRVPVSWVYDRTRKRSLDRLPGIRLGKKL
jgi:hypothetical protein